MHGPKRARTYLSFEVWAQLLLAEADCERIRAFLVDHFHLKLKFIPKKMHMTVYHARRPMRGVQSCVEPVSVVLPAEETRFMVMAPGGENPRPNLSPAHRKVGIRVQWQSSAMPAIQALRQRLIDHETPRVLGRRAPSTRRTNAFGARSFQPHMALLRAGSGVHRDLRLLGEPFRNTLGALHFDRFLVDVVCQLPDD